MSGMLSGHETTVSERLGNGGATWLALAVVVVLAGILYLWLRRGQ